MNPNNKKAMDTVHVPSPRTVGEDSSASSLQKCNYTQISTQKPQASTSRPTFGKQTTWRKTIQDKKCGFQSNLFIKIYSICHQQFSVCIVLINRHWEDLTSSSFNKSEFIFTTWYCTRSSVETDFFLTDLSLKKS